MSEAGRDDGHVTLKRTSEERNEKRKETREHPGAEKYNK